MKLNLNVTGIFLDVESSPASQRGRFSTHA